jgi:hypothetical protein
MRKADHARFEAASSARSTVMYFVRTVWELMRLKSETELPFIMQVETLRVFAVFFDGFEIMVTAPDSNEAQRRREAGGAPVAGFGFSGAETSSVRWKLFDLVEAPPTWRNLNCMMLSIEACWSASRMPSSVTTDIVNFWSLMA